MKHSAIRVWIEVDGLLAKSYDERLFLNAGETDTILFIERPFRAEASGADAPIPRRSWDKR